MFSPMVFHLITILPSVLNGALDHCHRTRSSLNNGVMCVGQRLQKMSSLMSKQAAPVSHCHLKLLFSKHKIVPSRSSTQLPPYYKSYAPSAQA